MTTYTLTWTGHDGARDRQDFADDAGLAVEEYHLLVDHGVRDVMLHTVMDGQRYYWGQRTASQWQWMRDYTAGELCQMAYARAQACDWGAAAILYRLSVQTYPGDVLISQMARADVAHRCERGNECARQAWREAHPDYRGPDTVQCLHPLTGVTVSISADVHYHHGCVHPEQFERDARAATRAK